MYNRSWQWIDDCWKDGNKKNGFPSRYFVHPEQDRVNQFDSILSTFFLVYSNGQYPAASLLDLFYNKQEKDGAIRCNYLIQDGSPAIEKDNPDGLNPPLFSWAEYNLYHKIGNKKRIMDVLPKLELYYEWLENNFRDENGLYAVPLSASTMVNSPRENARYLIDYNAQQAINAYYIAELADILNEKTIIFRYRKRYFALKALINEKMWHQRDKIYYDLDSKEKHVNVKTIASFWPLIIGMPDMSKAEGLIQHLTNPKSFASENPVPTLALSEPAFSDNGFGYRGSVFPPFTFVVLKGLEHYRKNSIAREYAIKHICFIIDALSSKNKLMPEVWEAYKPNSGGHAQWRGKRHFPRKFFMPYIGLSTISLMVEIIIGLDISLPKKTVNWTVPVLEAMGIENLALRRNHITILTSNGNRGWEIKHTSRKLYYFTIEVAGEQKRTLPIPSGRCVMLIDKI